MRRADEITIDGKKIEINEISGLESQNYIENIGTFENSFIDELFPERIPASLTKMCTGLTEEDLLAMYPSDIEKLIDKVEKANPTTASRIKKLATFGMEVLKNPELMQKLRENSSKEPAQD